MKRAPLAHRRSVLEDLISGNGELILSRRLAQTGLKAFQVAKKRGYEGLVAKRVASPYVPGRSRDWVKVKVKQEDEFIIVGYTEPAGLRQHFGALLLGAYLRGKLRYVGRVGTGFNQKNIAALFSKFQTLKRKYPTIEEVPGISRVTFLAPKLVAQVAYAEWTSDRKLPHPVFLGLREDKNASEVTL